MENENIRAYQEIERIDFHQYQQSLNDELRLAEARLASQSIVLPGYSVSTRRLEVFEKLVHERIRLRRTSIESAPELSSAQHLADIRSELLDMMEHTFEAIGRAARRMGGALSPVVQGTDEWADERLRLEYLINSQLRRIEIQAQLRGSSMQDSEPTNMVGNEPRWDVFISHASEDKEAVARPLRRMLQEKGLRVWIDEAELRMGDSLRQKIDEGLAHSRYGVVVLSTSFFAKRWPQQELNGLVAREDDGRKVILPVWHEVDKAYVTGFSPTLADRLAAMTVNGLERVVAEILNAIRPVDDSAAVMELISSGRPDMSTKDIFPGLTDLDVAVLRETIQIALGQGHRHVNGEHLAERLTGSGLSVDEIVESLDVLEHEGFLELRRVMGGPGYVQACAITCLGFERYAESFIDGYDTTRNEIERCIVQDHLRDNRRIAEAINQPIMLVDHVLDVLERERLITHTMYMGGASEIHSVSPLLKRKFRV